MDYRSLGPTGALVSSLCLGSMTVGKESDEASGRGQLDRSAEAGGNLLDTRPAVSSPILGARTLEQLEDTLAAADLKLSDEDRRRLDDVSAPGLPAYPYRFIAETSRR